MSTKIITLRNVADIVQTVGYLEFNKGLIAVLQREFARWELFDKTARLPFYKNDGVMELMPICGPEMFSYKYVNGHPNNPSLNKLTVVGSGLLAQNSTGEPQLIAEMTLLTALRTGATSAMVSTYLARSNSTKFGIIGCGSQSEFQFLAHVGLFPLQQVYYFDTDTKAMQKFVENVRTVPETKNIDFIACTSAQQVCLNSDIITTCTAFAGSQEIIHSSWLQAGHHVNAIGGDSPHKTELEAGVLTKANKLVVEFFEQTVHEGEIQNLENPQDVVYAELWEIITTKKLARESDTEITVFDGVGFALEDYCVLVYMNELSEKLGIFTELDMVPELENPKNLFGLLLG